MVHFDPIRFDRCFPELHGFVLLDPERLEEFCSGHAHGSNLLQRFSETEDGDRVSQDGIAIPLLGVEPGEYTVIVRSADGTPAAGDLRARSAGWILGTETGHLLLCGAGYLTKWDGSHAAHKHITVPPSWYRVDVYGYIADPGSETEHWTIEFVLQETQERPTFEALIDQEFRLVD